MILEMAAGGPGPGAWAGGWGGPWWVLIPLAWIALTATVVWLVVRRTGGSSKPRPAGATDILAARYARGEIDTDEYRLRLDELSGLR